MKRTKLTAKLITPVLFFSIASDAHALEIKADVWADNWFALYQGEELVKEDSTPFNTERSFNSESFTFEADLPTSFNVIIKDFYENDSGLEYIGSRRQQMGDGGFIAQFFDANTDELIAVSDDSWRCKVIHQAPLNRQCTRDNNPQETCESNISEEPEGWMSANFDDSDWSPATVHSTRDVRPHGGYRNVNWVSDAQLIWGDDIEVDNVVLCRFEIDAP
ncbi:MAG: hypothetical protein KTR16_09020 [Acidiferrobacterales bacterium]|nr:hypothetical protein [Acidiferrobacterales bacterium]